MSNAAFKRTSGDILFLPTAALQPVQQPKRKGRHPRDVINIRRGRDLKRAAARATASTKEDLGIAEAYFLTCKFLHDQALAELHLAKERHRSASHQFLRREK